MGGTKNTTTGMIIITIAPIVHDTQITIFRWCYKPTNITGWPPSCMFRLDQLNMTRATECYYFQDTISSSYPGVTSYA